MSKRRLIPSNGSSADMPIADLNTTPLIDVMLVLLIMFIITIPIASHKVPVDLPSDRPPPVKLEPVLHRLTLDAAGAIRLDGEALTLGELRPRLDAIRADPNATLLLQSHGETPYERFDQVMASVKRAGIDRLGMVANEGFRTALD